MSDRTWRGLAADVVPALVVIGASAAGVPFAGVAVLLAAAMVGAAVWRGRAAVVCLILAGILCGNDGSAPVLLGLPLTLGKTAVGLGAVALLARRRIALVGSPLLIGVAVVLVGMVASVAAAGTWARSGELLVRVVLLGGLVALLGAAIRPRDLPEVLRAVAVLFAVVVVASLPGGLPAVFDPRPDSAWQLRNGGPVGHHNSWAVCLLVLFPVGLVALRERQDRLSTVILGALVASVPLAILQTGSRGGFLALGVELVALPVLLRHRWRVLIAGLAVAAALSPLLVDLDGLFTRYASLLAPARERRLGHASLTQRGSLASAAFRLFGEHPLLGIGVGEFPSHAGVRAGPRLLAAHSTYLLVLAEQGLVGVLAHLTWLATAAAGTVRVFARRRLTVASGFVVAGAGTLAMAFTIDLFTHPVVWFAAGLAAVVARYDSRSAPIGAGG